VFDAVGMERVALDAQAQFQPSFANGQRQGTLGRRGQCSVGGRRGRCRRGFVGSAIAIHIAFLVLFPRLLLQFAGGVFRRIVTLGLTLALSANPAKIDFQTIAEAACPPKFVGFVVLKNQGNLPLTHPRHAPPIG
jgi:hypothetical protein